MVMSIKEMHAAPVATCWVWYRVGSRNERPGITGISHWVEHMMFKGTEKWGKGSIFNGISALGGYLNGFTMEDFTVYFETVPREHLHVPLDIESNRMTECVFDPEEVARERTVSVSEREVEDYYDTWIKENPAEKRTLDEMRDIMAPYLLKRKQALAFNSWVESLRKDADIRIDKKALGIE